MANQIILVSQKFIYKEISDQFPGTGSPKKKVFFQAELRSLAGGNASFGVIAYPAWKDSGKWVVGKKVTGIDMAAETPIPFVPPLAFANNEIVLSFHLDKKDKKGKKKNKKKDPRKGRWDAFMKMTRKAFKDKAMLESSFLLFNASVSENPHLEYNVTLDVGGTSLTVQTKPSPPAPPEA